MDTSAKICEHDRAHVHHKQTIVYLSSGNMTGLARFPPFSEMDDVTLLSHTPLDRSNYCASFLCIAFFAEVISF